jgi:hypothetical protein
MKTVNRGEVPFREQMCLSLQPVLHIVSGQRPLVHITEVGPSSHLVWGGCEINSALVYFRSRSWP